MEFQEWRKEYPDELMPLLDAVCLTMFSFT